MLGITLAKVAAEYLVIEGDLAACVLTFDIVNC